jgi:hypothetical protein
VVRWAYAGAMKVTDASTKHDNRTLIEAPLNLLISVTLKTRSMELHSESLRSNALGLTRGGHSPLSQVTTVGARPPTGPAPVRRLDRSI